jgi:pimeloyl-ACP methyl ester carboxylesterase
MILTNPGGPGGSGVDFLIAFGESLVGVIGTNYDIVSFDPRGLSRSIPSANCTPPPLSGPAISRRGLPKIHAPTVLDSHYEAIAADAKVVGDACQKQIEGADQAGPHMTTAVNVRDMISIVDAFARSKDAKGVENATLINYWGFSYGTVIGATLGSMFPDRIGRVVFDGVVDPEGYINGIDFHAVTETDKVVASFFIYCHLAGPEKCPFSGNTSVKATVKRFERLLFQLDPRHAVTQNWANATLIESALVLFKGSIFGAAYSPIDTFPLVGNKFPILEELVDNGSLATFVQLLSELSGPTERSRNIVSYERGVSCSDQGGRLYNKTLEDLRSAIRRVQKQSAIAGDSVSDYVVYCMGWPIVSNDQFAGKSMWKMSEIFD